jgi:hypothetical protein
MNIFHLRQGEDGFQVVERYPLGQEMVVATLLTEELAHQWLETYLRLLNMNGLVNWMASRPG